MPVSKKSPKPKSAIVKSRITSLVFTILLARREASSRAFVSTVHMDSKPATFGGHKYVVIRGRLGRAASVETLAVYRVRNDGILQRLRRYPVALSFRDDK
jgi:hypothetical protein